MSQSFRTILLLLFSANFSLAQDTDPIIAKGDSLIDAGKFAEAVVYYDKLIAKDASNERYYRGRGYAYLQLEQTEKGEADLKKAIQINPNCSPCYSNLGRVEANRGNIEKAIELLNTAIEKDDSNDVAYYVRGKIREFNQDQIGTMSDYNKAISLNPNEAIYYSERGKFRLNSGMKSLALKDLITAYNLDSNDAVVVYNRARYYTTVEDWELALIDLNRCIELDPSYAEYFGAKGTVLEFMGKHADAIEYHSISISLDSTDYLTFMNRAISKYSLENMDGFCEDNKTALRLIDKSESNQDQIDYLEGRIDEICNDKKKSYYYQRGIAAYNLGEFERGIVLYDAGLKRFPTSPMMLSFRGNALRAIGSDSLAIVDYKKSLAHTDLLEAEVKESRSFENNSGAIHSYLTGSIATVYMNISECYANLMSFDVAIAYADSAINTIEKSENQVVLASLLASVYNTRGAVYNIQGDYKKAIYNLEHAIGLDEYNPLPYVNLALATLNDQDGLNYQQMSMGVFVHSDFQGNQGARLPIVNKNKVSQTNLTMALRACNRALELDDKLAFGYLVRAQVKILLNEPGFCLDVLTAKQLGILDAETQLGVSCE